MRKTYACNKNDGKQHNGLNMQLQTSLQDSRKVHMTECGAKFERG